MSEPIWTIAVANALLAWRRNAEAELEVDSSVRLTWRLEMRTAYMFARWLHEIETGGQRSSTSRTFRVNPSAVNGFWWLVNHKVGIMIRQSASVRGDMLIKTYIDRATMSRAAARSAARTLREAIAARGGARIVAATGAAQFDFLEALTATPDIDWTHVEMFHLDEYIGLPIDHPASFRKFLLERLIEKTGIARYHLLEGEGDAARVADQVGREIAAGPIDVSFVGIGENAHIAFNDPPADFTTERPYLIVNLDEACRRQQVGEGWFASMAEVPAQAISMSPRQVLQSREIICIVPDARKARAVKACVEGDVSPMAPASILQIHASTTLFLDRDSAALLNPGTRGEILEVD
jgi:glucosamine-6-phosphate deaminase